MKFFCDECQAQYMISDDKVGPAGVRVRCKRCQHVILVKRLAPEEPPGDEPTVLMSAEKLAALGREGMDAPAEIEEDERILGDVSDEIGQALDSIFTESPSAPSPPVESSKTGPEPITFGTPESERAETKLLNPGELRQLAAEGEDEPLFSSGAETKVETKAKSDVEPSAAFAETTQPEGDSKPKDEWFIAVKDEQVGPLSVEEIKERFERGEVGVDTLVWAVGLPDWRPLSSIEELAQRIVPKAILTREREAPKQETQEVSRPVRSSPSGFKPSAASALASLASMAQEELAASDKASPSPSVSPSSTDSAGLLGELPAQTSSRSSPSGFMATASPPEVRDYASFAAPTHARSRREASRLLWPMVALGLVLIVGAFGAVWALVLKPQREQEQRRLATQIADELARQERARQPAAAAPVVPPPAPAPVTPPSVVANAPTPAAVPPVATPPAKAVVADNEDRRRGHRRGTRGAEPAAATAATAPATPAPSPAKGGNSEDFLAAGDNNNLDKEFAQELDGNPDNGGHGKSHRSVYIPPPPGQADLPQALSQSDIIGVVAQHKEVFARCVQDQKRRDPNSNGTIVMHWRIKPDGRPSDVGARAGDYQDSPLAGCFKGQIAKLHFGQYRGSPMAPIDFPFNF